MRGLSRLLLFGAGVILLVGTTGCGTRLKPAVFNDFFAKANLKLAVPAKEIRAAAGLDGGGLNPGKAQTAYQQIGKALDDIEDELGDIMWTGKQGHDMYRAYQAFLKTERSIYENELKDLVAAIQSGARGQIASLAKQIDDKERPELEKLDLAQKRHGDRLTLDVVRSRSPVGKR